MTCLSYGVIDESDLRIEQMRLIRIQIEYWESLSGIRKKISELDIRFARQRLENAELEFEISKVIHEEQQRKYRISERHDRNYETR